MPIKVTCWQARETGYTLAVVPQRHTISVLANVEESIYDVRKCPLPVMARCPEASHDTTWVKCLLRPDALSPQIGPEKPGSATRLPASAPVCPTPGRFRPGPELTTGVPAPPLAPTGVAVRFRLGRHKPQLDVGIQKTVIKRSKIYVEYPGSDPRQNNSGGQSRGRTNNHSGVSTVPTPRHAIPDGKTPEITDSKVRFGAGLDFGFHKPFPVFNLPAFRSESRQLRVQYRLGRAIRKPVTLLVLSAATSES